MRAFASPWWLLLFVPLLVRVVIVLIDRRRNFAAFRFSSLALVGRKRTIATVTSALPFVLEVAGLSLLVVALARPQEIYSISDDRYGVDIVVALDASGSMGAEDFRPKNRFGVAKELISDFVTRRQNDRIGIVTFGARAVTRVPITFDREAAREVLSKAEVGENGDGTAIGHAIATAVNRLRGSKARSRIIILVTDGVNNAGSIDPATAAQIAKSFGIKIYTIGVGSTGPVPVPVKVENRFTGEIETVYQVIRADLDEKSLREIAQTTGGAYFRAVNTPALEQVLSTIDTLEKSRLATPKTKRANELFAYPLALGLGLLALSLLMGETRWMRLPA